MRRPRSLALLAVLGLCAGPAFAAERDDGACRDFQKAILGVHATNPAAEVLDIVDGDDTASLLDVLNALPPASDVAGDHIAILFDPKEDEFLFVIGKEECADGVMEVKRSAIEAMIGKGS